MPRVEEEIPKGLRALIHHGLDLSWKGRPQAQGDCPFCAKEGKFYADPETGLWDCKTCGASGNPLTFLRQIHGVSEKASKDYDVLAEERGLYDPKTPSDWRAAKSVLTGEWLLPGWNGEEGLAQLYRWVADYKSGKRRLRATAGFRHCLYGVHLAKPERPIAYVCEGPWDAMAFREALALAKAGQAGLELTGSEGQSLLSKANVYAVPSCNTFDESWVGHFSGKDVVLLYHSDHPRQNNGSVHRDGWDGMRRAYQVLLSSREPPASVSCIRWGEEGYDPHLKSGYDVRDHLTEAGDSASGRVKRLESLLAKVGPVPEDWSEAVKRSAPSKAGRAEPLSCNSYRKLLDAWRVAMHWTSGLNHAFPICLAVCLSTDQVGDQLFLQLIGEAGSGKTRLCDGLLISKHNYPLEHLTGFYSGWRAAEGDDYSLLARVNHKTLITPEGDVLMSSPQFSEIMSQQRRIFDGTGGASFKTVKEDRRYEGLRTPWILAGTPALLNSDQSRLGDRFLRVIINPPETEERRAILRQVGYTAMSVVTKKSNCSPSSVIEESLLKAYRLTGGYVDYLRGNSAELLSKVGAKSDTEKVVDRCARLAELTADLRARPDPNKNREEKHDAKELPTRLTHQFVRLSCCLAAVLNKKEVDSDVLERVKKVAIDTAKGQTLEIVTMLYKAGEGGLSLERVASQSGLGDERAGKLLRFLKKIDVTFAFRPKHEIGISSKVRWRLTRRSKGLCQEVFGDVVE